MESQGLPNQSSNAQKVNEIYKNEFSNNPLSFTFGKLQREDFIKKLEESVSQVRLVCESSKSVENPGVVLWEVRSNEQGSGQPDHDYL